MIVDFLAHHGGRLAIGSTLLLTLISMVVVLTRQPLVRQRLAEGGILACLIWLVLAVCPLPRIAPATSHSEVDTTSSAKPVSLSATTNSEPVSLPTTSSAEVSKSSISSKSPALESMPLARLKPAVAVSAGSRDFVSRSAAFSIQSARTVAWCYIGSILVGVVFLLLARLRLFGIIRPSTPADGELLALWKKLAPPQSSGLLISTRANAPMCFGLMRPKVIIPQKLAGGHPETIRAVLRHELAHVAHRDSVGRTLFNVALPILWLHPLYWLLRRQAEFAAELRADADAANVDRRDYVRHLLEIFDRPQQPLAIASVAGLWKSETAFYRRMTMLLERETPLQTKTSPIWRTGMLTLSAAAVIALSSQFGVVYAQSQQRSAINPQDLEVAAERALQLKSQSQDAQAEPELAMSRKVASEYSTAGNADAGDAIGLAIAERKARLAGLKASGSTEVSPEQLRIELEIISLEGSRERLAIEKQLSTLREAILKKRLAMGESSARSSNQPSRDEMAGQVEEMERLASELETIVRKNESSIRQREQAHLNNAKRKLEQPAKTPAKDQKAGDPMAGNSAASSQSRYTAILEKLDESMQIIRNLRAENITLRQRIEELMASRRESADADDLYNSIAKLRHQLVVAITEIKESEIRAVEADRKYQRVSKLFATGASSRSDVEKERHQLEVSTAIVKQKYQVAESLKQLIHELETKRRVSEDSSSKK